MVRSVPSMSVFYFAADSGDVNAGKYEPLLQTARWADEHGFEAAWVPERHFQPFGGLYGSPSVTAAALAVLTRRLQIRAGSVVLPLQNVLRVAEEWSMIDNLSNGRVALSVAAGWHVNDFVLAPGRYEQRYEDMYAQIDQLKRLWRGERIVVPNGVNEPTEVAIYPHPIQRELRLWLTCRSEQSFVQAAEMGFNVLTANFSHANLESLIRCIASYRKTFHEKHGKRGHVTLMSHTFVAESEQAIEQRAKAAFVRYLVTNTFLQAGDARASQARQEGFADFDSRQRELMAQMKYNQHLDSVMTFVGTTSVCLEKMRRLKEVDVDEIACLIDFGVELPDVLDSLELVAKIQAA